jgi:hypothetical protein
MTIDDYQWHIFMTIDDYQWHIFNLHYN